MYFKKTLDNGHVIMVDKNGEVMSIMSRKKIDIGSLRDFNNHERNINFILFGIMITVYIIFYVFG
jgi:hypothetical protein